MVSSSPRSDLSRSASFYSAPEGISTTASSPVHGNPCRYRSAGRLQPDLKIHCSILLEEQLCRFWNYPDECAHITNEHLVNNATDLLNSLLASGVSRQSRGSKKAVPVPPASYLSLLATLTIQPFATTQASEPERLEASSQALDYLRNLLALVGPLNGNFSAAFQFLNSARSGRRPRHQSHGNNSDLSDGESNPEEDRLDSDLANQFSLWQRGQDFWSVFGWAMNCSALYPKRWRYWKSWLEFMLDAMERDWEERARVDADAGEADGNVEDVPITSRKESMIAMYLEQQSGRRGTFKAILKALFADGEGISSSFQEVFYKEPRGPKKGSKKRKRDTLDLDNDKWGDYFDDDSISSGTSEPPTPQKPRDQRKDTSFGTSQPGLSESVWIRLRLFKLLSLAVYTLQPDDLADLYEDFAAAVKVLPLPMFSLVVSQRDNPLLRETHITVLKELFRLLTPSNRSKDPSKVDPEAEALGALSARMLQECWAAHHANTLALEDNAKLSLAVENAVQLLWSEDAIYQSDELADAVLKGINARENRTKKKRTGKGKMDPSDILAQDVLSRSAERLHVLLDVIEATVDETVEAESS